MKKQIAVLMAAATAVTTVAPVLASADVNDYNASTSEVVSKITNALNKRYKNKTEDGINASNANAVDAYMNSVYAVAIKLPSSLNSAQLDKYDVVELAKSKYNNTPVYDEITSKDVFGTSNVNRVYIVKDASKVQGLIENNVIGKGTNDVVKVAIVAKGDKDGSAVETLTDKHYVITKNKDAIKNIDDETEVSLSKLANELKKELYNKDANGKKLSYVDTLKITIKGEDEKPAVEGTDYEGKKVTKVKLTLESGKEYTLEANDKAFDLAKPVDKDGNEIDMTKANAQNVLDTVEGFKYLENKDNKEATVVIPLGDTDVYTVQDVSSSTLELGKIFSKKDGYTVEGKDLVNGIVDARNFKNGNANFNFRGVNYTLAYKNGAGPITNKDHTDDAFYTSGDLKPKIEKVGNGYVLRYNVSVVNTNDNTGNVVLQFVIKGDSQKDLATVLNDLNGSNSVVAGHFTKLEGANRYETAIDVSVEKFDPETADTVVIVGGEALMDGLSAVPLASAKNAPILLAHPKTGLDNKTMSEIKRACKGLSRKTVYVVGGENSVPASVVKQLEDKFGAVVERVSGSDRFDTSLEVARRLKYDENVDVNKNLFIVGGEGAADAMSISPVAATNMNNDIKKADSKKKAKVSPILVVPKTGLKRTTRNFITEFKGDKYIVGGENIVSSDVYRNIVTTKEAGDVSRISGGNRFDTNVQIIKEFYTEKTDSNKDNLLDDNKIVVNGAVFTSGENKYLVDPQTAGPLAAEKQAPIVLSGSKLTNDQVNLLKDKGVLSDVKTDVYQIGGVVSADVMSVVVDKLGL